MGLGIEEVVSFRLQVEKIDYRRGDNREKVERLWVVGFRLRKKMIDEEIIDSKVQTKRIILNIYN